MSKSSRDQPPEFLCAFLHAAQQVTLMPPHFAFHRLYAVHPPSELVRPLVKVTQLSKQRGERRRITPACCPLRTPEKQNLIVHAFVHDLHCASPKEYGIPCV